jgi:hypothetical protein
MDEVDWKISIPDFIPDIHPVLGRARVLNLFPSLYRTFSSEKLKRLLSRNTFFRLGLLLNEDVSVVNMKMVPRGVETCFGYGCHSIHALLHQPRVCHNIRA